MCGKTIVCNELSGFFVGESAVQDTVGDGRVADREGLNRSGRRPTDPAPSSAQPCDPKWDLLQLSRPDVADSPELGNTLQKAARHERRDFRALVKGLRQPVRELEVEQGRKNDSGQANLA
jgi:hypothetical protein